jgi:hypothetical protein
LCSLIKCSLICNKTAAVIKDYNLKRHYDNKHASKYSGFGGQFRSDKLQQLNSQFSGHKSHLFKKTPQRENSVKVIYHAGEIANCRKPFADNL